MTRKQISQEFKNSGLCILTWEDGKQKYVIENTEKAIKWWLDKTEEYAKEYNKDIRAELDLTKIILNNIKMDNINLQSEIDRLRKIIEWYDIATGYTICRPMRGRKQKSYKSD